MKSNQLDFPIIRYTTLNVYLLLVVFFLYKMNAFMWMHNVFLVLEYVCKHDIFWLNSASRLYLYIIFSQNLKHLFMIQWFWLARINTILIKPKILNLMLKRKGETGIARYKLISIPLCPSYLRLTTVYSWLEGSK